MIKAICRALGVHRASMPESGTALELIEALKGTRIRDEDGYRCRFDMHHPASDSTLIELEASLGFAIPSELRQIWRKYSVINFYNLDMSTFYLYAFSRSETGLMRPSKHWVPFTDWGNGDTDWYVANGDPDYPAGSIVFFDHETERHALVTESLSEWIRGVAVEFQTTGALAHPYDYMGEPDRTGVYRSVFDAFEKG